MPARSITARDLRQILEGSRAYDAFARNRPVVARVPFELRQKQLQRHRSRSRSRSRTRRSRARSESCSRVPQRRCRCCDMLECRNRPTQATGSPYRRPQSAKTQSNLTRSASMTLPPRPSSAHARFRDGSRVQSKEMDFSGVSNMMRKLDLNSNRRWRSKSIDVDQTQKNDHNNNNKKSSKPVPEKLFTDVTVEARVLRQSRSSSYTKLKYPEKYHRVPFNKMSAIEEKIPACLRKFPRYRYFTQPTRHDCLYSPQGGAVSFVTGHNIRSGNLPLYKGRNNETQRSHESLSIARSHDESDSIANTYLGEAGECSNQPRNGLFNFVYDEPQTSTDRMRLDDVENDVALNIDDVENDVASIDSPVTSPAAEPRKSSNITTLALDVRKSSHDGSDVNEAEIIEELSDNDDGALPRSESQQDFEELMARITQNERKAEQQRDITNTRPSPFQRPEARLDERRDTEAFRAPSPAYSDAGSIPEEMERW